MRSGRVVVALALAAFVTSALTLLELDLGVTCVCAIHPRPGAAHHVPVEEGDQVVVHDRLHALTVYGAEEQAPGVGLGSSLLATLTWEISIHVAVVTGAVVILVLVFGPAALVFLPAVFSSRGLGSRIAMSVRGDGSTGDYGPGGFGELLGES